MTGNVLEKDILVTVISPGKPATPGTPGSPGSPAWDEVVDKNIYTTVGSVIAWDVASVTHTYNLFFYPLADIVSSTAPGATDTSPPPGGVSTTQVPIFGVVHVHYVIHHDAVAPVPPTPGDPGTPPVTSNNYQLGWNTSADSIGSIVASGEFQFSVNQSVVGVFAGLAKHPVVDDYPHIPYGLYFTNGKVQIYEDNDALTSAVSYVDSDIFTIRRLGPEIAYYQGSTLLYRSLVPSAPGNLSAVALMYSGGDEIVNASITQSVDTTLSATTAGVGAINVPLFLARGADTDGLGRINVPVPIVWSNNDGDGVVTVPALTVQGHSADAAYGFIALPILTIHGEQPALVPTYGIGQAVVPYMTAWGVVGQNPGGQISLPNLYVRGYDLFSGGLTNVPVPAVFGVDSAASNYIFATLPRLRMAMDIEVLPDYYNLGVRMTLPRLTLLAYGGGIVKMTLPTLTLSATVFSDYNVISFTLPKLTMSIPIAAGAVANVAMTLPKLGLKAYSGSFINMTLPKLTLAASGMSGVVAAVNMTLPEFTLAGSASAGWKADVAMTLPKIISAGWNFVQMSLPKLRLLTTNDPVYAVSDAYAVVLSNDKKPVTKYTNYPFQSIVRLGNDYIAFGSGGVRSLSGTTDAGTPISWSFNFGAATGAADDEAGDGLKKYTRACYFDGRFYGTVTATVSVDDGTTYSYPQRVLTFARDKFGVVPGLGLQGFAFTYGLAGVGPMDLYRCEFLQLALNRKVKHG